MLFGLLDRGESVHSAAWFDTGWEFPQMHDHIEAVREMIAPVPLVTLYPRMDFVHCMMDRPLVRPRSKSGKPRAQGWGWPSAGRRWCTKEKTMALDKYIQGIGGGITCIGFAADEAHRAKSKRLLRIAERVRFPLIDWGMTEAAALADCRRRGFSWGGLYDHFSRVSCFCCPLKSLSDIRKIRHHYPDLWATMLTWDAMMPDNRGFKGFDTVRDLEARFAEADRQGRLVEDAAE